MNLANLSINRLVTGLSLFLAFIASAPPSLQNQIPQLFPEKYRGFIALALAFVAFGAHATIPTQKPSLAPPLFQPTASPVGDASGHTPGKS